MKERAKDGANDGEISAMCRWSHSAEADQERFFRQVFSDLGLVFKMLIRMKLSFSGGEINVMRLR